MASDGFVIQRRVFPIVFGVYAALYLGLFFFGVFTFPEKHFLPTFRGAWSLSQAFIRFMSVLIAAHCTSILLIYSFAPRQFDSDLSRSISVTVIAFVILTAPFAIMVEGLEPRARRVLAGLRYQTIVARSHLESARQAFEEGAYEESRRYLAYYRDLDPGNQEAANLWGAVTDRLSQRLGAETPLEESSPRFRIERSPDELIRLALAFLESDDAFSAYFYAELAKSSAAQRGEVWREADRVSATAAGLIEALRLTAAERSEAELFATKKRGIEALGSLDPSRNVEGYYIFVDLSFDYPDDPEVKRYLSEAKRLIETVSFFLDDAERIRPLPGTRSLVFVNSWPDPESGIELTELVSIGKIVLLDIGTFAESVEVIGLSKAGARVYHYKAALAELIGGVLIMRGIDRQDPSRTTRPEVIVAASDGQSAEALALRPPIEDLLRLSIAEESIEGAGFVQLLEMAEMVAEYGYHAASVRAAALERLSAPFTVFAMSLLFAGLGLHLKPEKGRPTAGSMMLLPLVPLLVYALIEFYRQGVRIATSWLALTADFSLSLLLVLAWNLVILVFVIFFLARAERR